MPLLRLLVPLQLVLPLLRPVGLGVCEALLHPLRRLRRRRPHHLPLRLRQEERLRSPCTPTTRHVQRTSTPKSLNALAKHNGGSSKSSERAAVRGLHVSICSGPINLERLGGSPFTGARGGALLLPSASLLRGGVPGRTGPADCPGIWSPLPPALSSS